MNKKEAHRELRGHGWDAGDFGVATLERGDVTLDFDFDPTDGAEKSVCGLQIGGPDGSCQLWIHYDRMEPVLKALVAIQQDITTENFRDKVRPLLDVATKVEVQLDEDGDPVLLEK